MSKRKPEFPFTDAEIDALDALDAQSGDAARFLDSIADLHRDAGIGVVFTGEGLAPDDVAFLQERFPGLVVRDHGKRS
jgi:hypothetical protein